MTSDYERTVINPGDLVSKMGYKACVGSYGNSRAVLITPQPEGKFRGLVGHRWNDHVSACHARQAGC